MKRYVIEVEVNGWDESEYDWLEEKLRDAVYNNVSGEDCTIRVTDFGESK